MDNLKTWPGRIWLQHGDDEVPPYDGHDEVTWCQDSVNGNDIGYIRADAVEMALARAFTLGQTYFCQADSESSFQHRLADKTLERYSQLVKDILGDGHQQ